jgi:hypothetical protein
VRRRQQLHRDVAGAAVPSARLIALVMTHNFNAIGLC